MSASPSPEIIEETLDKMAFHITTRLSHEMASKLAMEPQIKIEAFAGFLSDDYLIKINQAIWGKQLDSITVIYPNDWWQALKDRWFPAWAKRRWPIVYTRHTLEAKALFPTIPKIDDHESIMWLAKHDDPPIIRTD